jgi:PAT family beta-lactamase induction signal transducer AmpG
MCLAWLPYRIGHEIFGAAQPIANTLFTLVFVGSALFLLAGAALLGASARRLARAGAWFAPLLLLMHLRYHSDAVAAWFGGAAAGVAGAIDLYLLWTPPLAGVLLLALALRPWAELHPATMPAAVPA